MLFVVLLGEAEKPQVLDVLLEVRADVVFVIVFCVLLFLMPLCLCIVLFQRDAHFFLATVIPRCDDHAFIVDGEDLVV